MPWKKVVTSVNGDGTGVLRWRWLDNTSRHVTHISSWIEWSNKVSRKRKKKKKQLLSRLNIVELRQNRELWKIEISRGELNYFGFKFRVSPTLEIWVVTEWDMQHGRICSNNRGVWKRRKEFLSAVASLTCASKPRWCIVFFFFLVTPCPV